MTDRFAEQLLESAEKDHAGRIVNSLMRSRFRANPRQSVRGSCGFGRRAHGIA
jgi:hypothetical protein